MVMNKDYKYPDTKAYNYVVKELESKGVTTRKIAEIAYDLEHNFLPDYTLEDYEREVISVLHKREVLNNAMVALNLDNLANQNLLSQPLQEIVEQDSGVFGVDETLATQIANIFGSIGVTNYGFVDRTKPRIIGKLDNREGVVNTFIDDIVGGIASAVAGKLAHKNA